MRWRAFPLRPDTPEDGVPMEKIFSHLTDEEYGGLRARLRKAAEDEGLRFRDRVMTFNSRLAQELGKWAGVMGKGDEFHHAAFEAYLADGKNIGKVPVLQDIAASVGLPREEAGSVIEKGTFRAEVDADWVLCRTMDISVAPTFVLNKERLVGAQPYERLAEFLEANGVRKRVS